MASWVNMARQAVEHLAEIRRLLAELVELSKAAER